MSDDLQDLDVIVVGGGFAGLVAARELVDQGRRVVLLEARDRLGGRAWTSTFPGTDRRVDMGGQWLYPDGQPGLVNELSRYRVATDHSPMPGSFPTVLAGGRNPGPLPVPFEQFPDLERAILRCQLAASRISPGDPMDHQGLADLDVPFSEFLAPLALPAETYAFVTAVAAVYLCRYPEEMSALAVLHQLALLDLSAFAMWGVIDVRFADGASSLYDRIAADLPDVRLSTPVTGVRQDPAGVTVTTADGTELRAAAAVVATPMNLWNDIAFSPVLSTAKREASAERHGVERSGKAWLRVRNAPPNPFVIADPASNAGALMISTEHTFDDGDQLMPMFGVQSLPGDGYELDCADPASAEKALQTLLPEARLVDHYAHDYNSDPWSQGDWASYRPGRLSRSHSVLGAPEGRCAFATSDVAPKWIMWIEGAVECGYRAARQASRILEG